MKRMYRECSKRLSTNMASSVSVMDRDRDNGSYTILDYQCSEERLAARKRLFGRAARIRELFCHKYTKTNVQVSQRTLSGPSVIRPFVKLSDHMLALYQRDTLKTVCLLLLKVVLERLEELNNSGLHISVRKYEYVVGNFQLTMQSVLSGKS